MPRDPDPTLFGRAGSTRRALLRGSVAVMGGLLIGIDLPTRARTSRSRPVRASTPSST